jgi:hypothetical protein
MNATKWTEESITALLVNNDRAVERAILAIYDRQTADEKSAQTTRHSNRMGFSWASAQLGSYYAKWIKSGRKLTGTHLDRARKMAIKYRRQLCAIAADKATTADTTAKVCACATMKEQWEAGFIAQSEAVCPVHGQVKVQPDMSANRSEGVSDCDNCLQTARGVEYTHNGAPVLFLCYKCDKNPEDRTAQHWNLTARR